MRSTLASCTWGWVGLQVNSAWPIAMQSSLGPQVPQSWPPAWLLGPIPVPFAALPWSLLQARESVECSSYICVLSPHCQALGENSHSILCHDPSWGQQCQSPFILVETKTQRGEQLSKFTP